MHLRESIFATIGRLKVDTCGAALSSELSLVLVVALIGMLVAFSALRDSIVSELSDVGGSTQDLTLTYHVDGLVGSSSSVAGMSFSDATDHCDSPEDPAGAADNCIVFDVAPRNELPPVAPEQFVVDLAFDGGDASDTSPFGGSNNGVLVGDPDFVGGAVELDGDDAIFLSNTSDINIGIHGERTISLDFNASDVTTRQVLYEEGAGARGLVIYVENGLLYIGGWNIPTESGWAPTFISTPISAGVTNTATLVLNGGATVQPGGLTGFLNGTEFGSASGSQLWTHGGGIGIGATNGSTIFHDGASGASNFFTGTIDNFGIYNRVLTDDEIGTLANQ